MIEDCIQHQQWLQCNADCRGGPRAEMRTNTKYEFFTTSWHTFWYFYHKRFSTFANDIVTCQGSQGWRKGRVLPRLITFVSIYRQSPSLHVYTPFLSPNHTRWSRWTIERIGANETWRERDSSILSSRCVCVCAPLLNGDQILTTQLTINKYGGCSPNRIYSVSDIILFFSSLF